ncbi:S66 peptidase family protein [Cetobacterium sp. ZWU0022]|uniref:S66 family peptidase n=1 Tax=Cetobacterium sp. ZWU0022 TaxID=1340502 RepID=UPI00064924F2|nr:S66 peptidase family protein [Cetobacterium sp. ZWU0022]
MRLIKPSALKKGDKVATVSLSWGGAGNSEILWRYEQGKKRLVENFGLDVIEMPNTLKGESFIYNHPEKRAQDLMDAFKDKSIKGIFTCIGGEDSIRILPFIDFNIIKNNPKVFMGYSDSTVTHFICLKAGISSFYGPSILAEFAENLEMFDYTKYWFEKTVFEKLPIGNIPSSNVWTNEYLPWDIKNKLTPRNTFINKGYELLQGTKTVQGHLIGGCMEVLEMIKCTEIWPSKKIWKNAILFLEVSESITTPLHLEYWLRNYGAQGILNSINGIIFGKPRHSKFYDEYKQILLKVIRDEYNLKDLPILYNLNFGHTSPIITIPFGAQAEINCEQISFKILEAGVI